MADSGLRRITVRIEHDCPIAQLGLAHPKLTLEIWSGHHVELVSARVTGRAAAAFRASLQELLDPIHIVDLDDGVMALWRPGADPTTSITRRIEQHGLVWLQPLTVRAGWEHYELLAFKEGAEDDALRDLQTDHTVQVARRADIGPDQAAASLFVSLRPLLDAPTDKQVEALLAAGDAGYYQSPRATTTAQVARTMGIGRSAFEERLRGGENHVMRHLLPALEKGRAGRDPS